MFRVQNNRPAPLQSRSGQIPKALIALAARLSNALLPAHGVITRFILCYI
jgi:hypothetical protein